MIKIFKEQGGMISNEPIWICFESCYMYVSPTLFGLIWQVITEWRHDRHTVG